MDSAEIAKQWAAGFEDLQARMGDVIAVTGNVEFDIQPGALPDGTPGVVIRFDLPDGRVALAGMGLLAAHSILTIGAEECGFTYGGTVIAEEEGPGGGVDLGVSNN